jgi:hypothetical protein
MNWRNNDVRFGSQKSIEMPTFDGFSRLQPSAPVRRIGIPNVCDRRAAAIAPAKSPDMKIED